MRVLQMMCLVLEAYFQEWPLGTRNMRGTFVKRMIFHVDLVFRLNDKLMAIEVHGGSEHVNCQKAIQRDLNKKRGCIPALCGASPRRMGS